MKRIELLSPAGNLEKLDYAYTYGADAAYIGFSDFSLRTRADNFHQAQKEEIIRIKGKKRLYCALNIYLLDSDFPKLMEMLSQIREIPFDAFIISDLGLVDLLKREFPSTPLHLSTQANCLNSGSAKVYRDLGFKRIILGRETPISEIKSIKDQLPDMELEVFVHGAMCLAYSGRCFLSAYMADRSANRGDCAHSCRWNYRILEEEKRPGEYFPVLEEEGYTSILSSKDLCMIDHLKELAEAGVDSVKIEGRMKSLYYTAVVTRAYRKALDFLQGEKVPFLEEYRKDLFKVSHREYSTGFFFDKSDIEKPALGEYIREYQFIGTIGKPLGENRFLINLRNSIKTGETLEYLGADIPCIQDNSFRLFNEQGKAIDKSDHGKVTILSTVKSVAPKFIIRKRL